MTHSSGAAEDATPLLRWDIPDGAVSPLSGMRRAVADALPDLADDTVIDVKLICTELVTNVHQHARTAGELRINSPASGVISIEVDDGSVRRPVVASGPPGARPCRGWNIVDAVARQWGVRPVGHGKTVWIEVDCDAAA